MNRVFDREHRNHLFHGVAKVGALVSHSSSLKAQLSLWESEVKTRKHTFGTDVFDIMSRNRNAGEGTGGEAEPEIVEIFADAVTDVRFLIDRRQQKQADLVKVTNKSIPGDDYGTDDESDEPPVPGSRRGFGRNYSGYSNMDMAANQQPTRSWPAFGLGTRFVAPKFLQKPSAEEEETKKIKSQIAEINKAIDARKHAFGIELFDKMVSLGKKYRPSDPRVAELFKATKKDVKEPLKKSKQAKKELLKRGNTVSHQELKEFVKTNPKIWAMLSVNIQIAEEECQDVAFRVALELATGRSGHEAMDAILTKRKFQKFQKKYIEDPKGHQEFFHRTVFMAFDEDWNGVLDRDETDKFLDTFYISGSIFQGDKRLPEKEELKVQILEQLDENGDGMFSFDEIRSLISGRGDRTPVA